MIAQIFLLIIVVVNSHCTYKRKWIQDNAALCLDGSQYGYYIS